MVRLIYLLALTIFILGSCSIVFKDDILSLKRKPNKSSMLKINGCYKIDYGFGITEVYFLYNNGIILCIGGVNNNGFEDKINELTQKNDLKLLKAKFSWGVYEIETDTIRFERWYPSDKPYRTTIREGKIINDSTFIITRTYKGIHERERNEVYKFRDFSPKPDSTNRFIK
jgi:hypothetical protein